MFRDEAIEVAPTWAQDDNKRSSYREIDKKLRRLAKRRAALDVEEARWLREAERGRIWRKLGFSTALEYLEDVFGHAPRTAMERLRVAKELGELPALEQALRSGALPWSAVKELSRVMTPATEARWLARARGRNVHEIQRLVSGRKKGDAPDGPQDPERMTRRLVLELPPALDALFERTRLALEKERGEHLDDLVVFEAMCMHSLQPAPVPADGKAPKPMHRIITYKCDECRRAWREGRGRLVPIASADLELAECDAELVGELRPAVLAYDERTDDERADDDGDGNRGNDSIDKSAMPLVNRKPDDAVPRTKNGRVRTKRRPPPTQTIPKATRDFVWARDHGRCCVPGCRATRNIAAHHIVFLSQGGDHDPSNIMLLCDGHHKILHTGVLVITGRAPDQLTFVRDGKRLIDPRSSMELEADHNLRLEAQRAKTVGVRARVTGRKRFDDVVTLEHAKQALMQLGFKARAARAALDAACAHVGADADVAMLVKAVLDLGREGPLSSVDSEDMRRDAMGALVGLGYSSQTATAAVELANAHVGAAADLSTLIKEALRRCAS